MDELTNTTESQIAYSECYAQVFLGDCLELYKKLEPKSIDLILTDLPYGTTACKWDTIIPFDKLWEMINYLLKPNGAFITTASQPFTSALVMSNPKMFRYEYVWDKVKGSGFLNANKMPIIRHEQVLIFYNSLPTYNKQLKKRNSNSHSLGKVQNYTKEEPKNTGGVYGMQGIEFKKRNIIEDYSLKNPDSIIEFSVGNNRGKYKRYHPTQKPIELMQYLLKTYSNENMTIFDPCMGSGTTGVACKNLNRNFIGIEKDEAYFKIAEQRINARTLFS